MGLKRACTGRRAVKVGLGCGSPVKSGLDCGQTGPRLRGTSREWSKSVPAVDKVGAGCRCGRPLPGQTPAGVVKSGPGRASLDHLGKPTYGRGAVCPQGGDFDHGRSFRAALSRAGGARSPFVCPTDHGNPKKWASLTKPLFLELLSVKSSRCLRGLRRFPIPGGSLPRTRAGARRSARPRATADVPPDAEGRPPCARRFPAAPRRCPRR